MPRYISVDSKIIFASGLRNICSKVSKSIGICNRLDKPLPSHIFRNLFISLIHSFLTYGMETWDRSPSAQLKILNRKIDKCVKILGNERVLVVNYQKLNTLLLGKISQLFTHVKVFRYYHLNQIDHFYELFGCQEVSHHTITRDLTVITI